ncbi:MAG: hypothetical protein QF421_04645, partial [Candidatus Poseidoniia archaeon]|nr:hypothetical protein [Candidatus Poseidoniia archaeon]
YSTLIRTYYRPARMGPTLCFDLSALNELAKHSGGKVFCGLVGLRLAWRLQGGDANGARAWCLLMALISIPKLPLSLPVALPALFGAWRLWGGVR